jgi:hypothetical protein
MQKTSALTQWAELPRVGWILLALVVITLVPRLIHVVTPGPICPDGVFFCRAAEEIRSGDHGLAFDVLGINLFPLMMVAVGSLGMSDPAAGSLISLIAGTLTVLPLFGLMDRIVGRGAAVLGCLLYAGHPMAIEWSGQVVRDPLFWLLFTTSLYAMWRATESLGLGWFALAGLSGIAAALTRTEGFLLVVPLAIWGGYRLVATPRMRMRAAIGTGIAATVGIVALIVANTLMLSPDSSWQWGRLAHVTMLQESVARLFAEEPETALDPAAAEAARIAAGGAPVHIAQKQPGDRTASEMFAYWLRPARRGIDPVYAVFLVLGMVYLNRKLFSLPFLPLLLMSLGVSLAVWIHLEHRWEASSRYFVTIVLVTLPIAGYGLCKIADDVLSYYIAWRLPWPSGYKNQTTLRLIWVACFCIYGGALILTRVDETQLHQQQIGLWLLETEGPGKQVAASEGQLVAFYGKAELHTYPAGWTRDELADWLGQFPDCDLLMLPNGWTPDQRDWFVTHVAPRIQYEGVPAEFLPQDCKVTVLRKTRAVAEPISQATRDTAPLR